MLPRSSIKSTVQRRLIDVNDFRPCKVTLLVNLQFFSVNDSFRVKCSRQRSVTVRSKVISRPSASRLRCRRKAFNWSPFLTNVKAKGICRQRNSRVIKVSSFPNRYVLGRIKVNKLEAENRCTTHCWCIELELLRIELVIEGNKSSKMCHSIVLHDQIDLETQKSLINQLELICY